MNNLNSIKTWSKSKQANIISDIVSKYPTARDFKMAVLKNGDDKSRSLVQNMDEKMSREQYIDFLQYMFVKHSSTGKILLNSLVGLGLGAGLAYLLGKEAQSRARNYQISKETNTHYDPLKGEVDVSKSNLNDIKNSNVGKLADQVSQDLSNNPITSSTVNSIKNSNAGQFVRNVAHDLGNKPLTTASFIKSLRSQLPDNITDLAKDPSSHIKKITNSVDGINFKDFLTNVATDVNKHGAKNTVDLADKLHDAYVAGSAINDRIQNVGDMGKYAGGAVGLGVGGYSGSKLSNLIQKWNNKKQQEKINSLKYSK